MPIKIFKKQRGKKKNKRKRKVNGGKRNPYLFTSIAIPVLITKKKPCAFFMVVWPKC